MKKETTTRLGFTQNIVICPPCGESVAGATKEGQNWKKSLWSLLPRLTAVLPSQGREMSRAFTLIELLVVVLIIGILTAVAVPQYQKSVWKSEFQRLIPILHAVYKGEQLYFVENGHYTPDWRELSITLPDGTTVTSNASAYNYTLPNGMRFASSISTPTPRAFFKDIMLDLELSSGILTCYHKTNKDKLKICRTIGCQNDGINACSFKLF